MHSTSWLLRGKWLHSKKTWMGVQCFPVEARHIGGTPSVRPAYFHFKNMRAERPVRAYGMNVPLLPVLYNRQDQVMLIENALALSRIENQISVTLSQLAIGIRNAEEFVEKYLLNKEVRPSMHTLWFHEEGLRNQQHLLSSLSSHHLVPMFSLISHDVESGKMQTFEAIELYEELMDSTVAHAQIVRRELANQMVRVHCLNGDYEKASEIVEEMKQRRIRRTFVTYAPMFRMIRGQDDAAQHERLLTFMYSVEGGSIAKFLYIDVPRMLYMFGVMIRHNWMAIYFTFLCCSSAAVYFWYYIRPLPLAQ